MFGKRKKTYSKEELRLWRRNFDAISHTEPKENLRQWEQYCKAIAEAGSAGFLIKTKQSTPLSTGEGQGRG